MYTASVLWLREYIRYNSPGAKSKLLRWPEETCKLGRLASSARGKWQPHRARWPGHANLPPTAGQAEGKQKPPLTKGGTRHRGVSARCQARSQRMQPAWPLLHRGGVTSTRWLYRYYVCSRRQGSKSGHYFAASVSLPRIEGPRHCALSAAVLTH